MQDRIELLVRGGFWSYGFLTAFGEFHKRRPWLRAGIVALTAATQIVAQRDRQVLHRRAFDKMVADPIPTPFMYELQKVIHEGRKSGINLNHCTALEPSGINQFSMELHLEHFHFFR